MDYQGRLPRLTPSAYCGFACVHWTMALEKRATGWLDALFHARLREVLLHACSRFGVICPVYCLMPDHGHFLLMGVREAADQRACVRLFRQQWNRLLAPDFSLQKQAYDHVLRSTERERAAFAGVAHYILENPERAGLVESWRDWASCGSLVPGYPSLDPGKDVFWESFWLAHAAVCDS